MTNEYNQKFKIPDYPTVINIDRKTQSGVDANYSELIGNIFTVINIGEMQLSAPDGTNNQTDWLGNNNVPQGLKFILPQPEDLSWDSAYEWASEKVFPVNIMKQGEQIGNAFMNSMKEDGNILSRLAGGFKDGGIAAGTAINGLLSQIGSHGGKAAFLAFKDTIAGMVNNKLATTVLNQIEKEMKANGTTINPNYKLFFNGVQQEQFSLSFKLNSTNKEESKNIVNVINSLKYYSAPDTSGVFFLTPPPLVGVKVLANIDKQPISLIERKPLVITNIGVNLSNGSLTIHEDGIPTSIALNIGFREFHMPIRKNIGEQILLGNVIDPNKRKKS